MAEAKQCDFCKSFYTMNNSTNQDAFDLLDTENLLWISEKPKLPLVRIILQSSGTVKGEKDVCDSCGKKLIDFIKKELIKE